MLMRASCCSGAHGLGEWDIGLDCYWLDAMSTREGARKIRLPEGLSGPDR